MARKEKKYHFIYKTTNLLNGKYYIGMHSTDNLDDGYMGSGKRLRYSINKHGKDNHKVEILEFVDTREELKVREEEIINLNEIAKVECMNLRVGGEGGFFSLSACTKGGFITGNKHAERMKIDLEYSNKVKKRLLMNMKKAHATGNIPYGISFKDKHHSEETKQKMSESSKGQGAGKTNSQYGTCWITNGTENKKIKKEDLETYTSDGWGRGRGRINKIR